MGKLNRTAVIVAMGMLICAFGAKAQVHALQIEGPDGGRSILIGTMHVGRPDLLQPAPSILDGANRLIVEVLVDDHAKLSPADLPSPAVMDEVKRTGHFPVAPWAENITDNEKIVLRQRVACTMREASPDIMVGLLLSLPRPRLPAIISAIPCTQTGLESRDDMIVGEAKRRGLQIVPLESAAENKRQIDGVSDASMLEIMHGSLSSDFDATLTAAAEAINQGDWEKSQRLDDAAMDASGQDSWHQKMMVERNALWLPRLAEDLKGGGAVVMVGAAHLGGQGGMMQGLKSAGFDISPIIVPAQDK